LILGEDASGSAASAASEEELTSLRSRSETLEAELLALALEKDQLAESLLEEQDRLREAHDAVEASLKEEKGILKREAEALGAELAAVKDANSDLAGGVAAERDEAAQEKRESEEKLRGLSEKLAQTVQEAQVALAAEWEKTAAAEASAAEAEARVANVVAERDEALYYKSESDEKISGLSEKLAHTVQEAQGALAAEQEKTAAAEIRIDGILTAQNGDTASLQADLLASREEVAVKEDSLRERDDRLHDLGEQMKAAEVANLAWSSHVEAIEAEKAGIRADLETAVNQVASLAAAAASHATTNEAGSLELEAAQREAERLCAVEQCLLEELAAVKADLGVLASQAVHAAGTAVEGEASAGEERGLRVAAEDRLAQSMRDMETLITSKANLSAQLSEWQEAGDQLESLRLELNKARESESGLKHAMLQAEHANKAWSNHAASLAEEKATLEAENQALRASGGGSGEGESGSGSGGGVGEKELATAKEEITMLRRELDRVGVSFLGGASLGSSGEGSVPKAEYEQVVAQLDRLLQQQAASHTEEAAGAGDEAGKDGFASASGVSCAELEALRTQLAQAKAAASGMSGGNACELEAEVAELRTQLHALAHLGAKAATAEEELLKVRVDYYHIWTYNPRFYSLREEL